MRTALVFGLVVMVAMVPAPSQALGGAAVVGVGSGTGTIGGLSCDEAPFVIAMTFWPQGGASATLAWAGNAECAGALGGAFIVGTLAFDSSATPPVGFTPGCTGSEAAGIDCGDLLRTGPYGGPGSQVWVESMSFRGTFTAL